MKTLNRTAIRLFSALLLCILLLSAAGCQEPSNGMMPDTKQHKSAGEFGIVQYGFIPEADFPESEALAQWFKNASSRSGITSSLLCARDEGSNLWYCWLYIGARCRNDVLEITVDDTDGCNVYLNLVSSALAGENKGAYAFTLPGEVEPSFAFFIDGKGDGLIFTVGRDPVIPKSAHTAA